MADFSDNNEKKEQDISNFSNDKNTVADWKKSTGRYRSTSSKIEKIKHSDIEAMEDLENNREYYEDRSKKFGDKELKEISRRYFKKKEDNQEKKLDAWQIEEMKVSEEKIQELRDESKRQTSVFKKPGLATTRRRAREASELIKENSMTSHELKKQKIRQKASPLSIFLDIFFPSLLAGAYYLIHISIEKTDSQTFIINVSFVLLLFVYVGVNIALVFSEGKTIGKVLAPSKK